MKVLTIIGARPQFIKAATVSREFIKDSTIEEVIVHTGQHYDQNMSDIFFEELSIPRPNYNLSIGGKSHGAMTGQMLEEIEKVILTEKPTVVLVYGDTNSTIAGALAASKLHIPVAHIEAGLRSFNKKMPEEQNRVLTDHISSILFAPTEQARLNLENEGVNSENVFVVGDVMKDAALFYGGFKSVNKGEIQKKLNLKPNEYILATIHRAENTDCHEKMSILVDSLIEVSKNISILLPIHPRTRKTLKAMGLLEKLDDALNICDPLGYLEMISLEKQAKLILTDSGGVQKEAYFHSVPCVTLREETEWVELVEIGFNYLCPLDSVTQVVQTIFKALEIEINFETEKLYGDGNSASSIVSQMKKTLVK